MESLYAQYLRERTTDGILETATGFATYRYLDGGKSVYVVDIYVVPGHRKSGEAAALADAIACEAKAKGCSEMIGTVQPSAKGATTSLKVLLAYGMELQSAGADCIILSKKI